jgi:hypothetical protein
MYNIEEQISQCDFADEIVAYIYRELKESRANEFESHLLGCEACSNDLAGFSNARLSVVEWRNDAFSHLETPQITIPYTERREVSVDSALISFDWITRIRTAVAASIILRYGTAFAVLTIIAGGFYFGFLTPDGRPRGEQLTAVPQVVDSVADLLQAENADPIAPQREVPGEVRNNDKNADARNLLEAARILNRSKAINQTRVARTPGYRANRNSGSTLAIERTLKPRRMLESQKALSLNNEKDNDDNSLRLGELLDQIDS